MDNILQKVAFNEKGLIPAVIQDAVSGKVLMLAYMNREALCRTIESGTTWFYSRSRDALWHKGETSGHTQRVLNIFLDCDGDSLLIQVEQKEVACHTEHFSCFHRKINAKEISPPGDDSPPYSTVAFLQELFEIIEKRALKGNSSSYTLSLLKAPHQKVLRKLSEETTEVLLASMEESDHKTDNVRWEAADLLYHLLVLLKKEGLTFLDVCRELLQRHKTREPGTPVD